MSAAVIRTGVRLGLQILGGWESQAFDSPSEAPFFVSSQPHPLILISFCRSINCAVCGYFPWF